MWLAEVIASQLVANAVLLKSHQTRQQRLSFRIYHFWNYNSNNPNHGYCLLALVPIDQYKTLAVQLATIATFKLPILLLSFDGDDSL